MRSLLILLAVGLVAQYSAAQGSSSLLLSVSNDADFSSTVLEFTLQDTVYFRVPAPDARVSSASFHLKPKGKGERTSGQLRRLGAFYAARVPVSALQGRADTWSLHAELRSRQSRLRGSVTISIIPPDASPPVELVHGRLVGPVTGKHRGVISVAGTDFRITDSTKITNLWRLAGRRVDVRFSRLTDSTLVARRISPAGQGNRVVLHGLLLDTHADTLSVSGVAVVVADSVVKGADSLEVGQALRVTGRWNGSLQGESIHVLRDADAGSDDPGERAAFDALVASAAATEIKAEQPVRPVTFSLAQNYPNPFNPATSISFDLTEDAHVVLTVHDILGRTVRTLLSGAITSGRHTVSWDGRSAAGFELPSGLYVYTMHAGGTRGSRRMTLLR